MGMSIAESIPDGATVLIDTNPLIYWYEGSELAAPFESAGNGFSVRDTNADIAMLAARLRLRHRLKLPDAIQFATAVHAGCFALISHDRDFSRVDDVLILGMV
jgi:predicted nucleic acid-binding protein